MQPNDNKWGFPLEMTAWFFPIVLLALAAAMITPLINRKVQRLKKERIAAEQMAERTNAPLEQAVSPESPVETP
jgi:cytochrome c-type biogenesis protein CcmH/NrfF